MLAVIGFVAFWVIVALILFLIAARPTRRGGLRSARAGSRNAIMMFVATAAIFGVAIPLLMLTNNHSSASAQVGGVTLSVDQQVGRQLFGAHCGMCHTLAAANTAGKVGPDLDILRPSESLILHTVANGCLPNPPSGSPSTCLGQGVMPADVVQGQQARQVASFVAKVAGTE